MRLFWTKRAAINALKHDESVTIGVKNGQINTLKKIIDYQQEQIDAMLDQMKTHKSASVEEQVVEGVLSMLKPQPQGGQPAQPPPFHGSTAPPAPAVTADAGRRLYEDTEILTGLSKVPTNVLAKEARKGREHFVGLVKEQIPDINDESARRAYELALAVI